MEVLLYYERSGGMDFEALRSAAWAIVDTEGTPDQLLSESLTHPFPVEREFLQTLGSTKSLPDVEVDLKVRHSYLS